MELKSSRQGGVSHVVRRAVSLPVPLLLLAAAAVMAFLPACMTPRKGFIGETRVWEHKIRSGEVAVDTVLRQAAYGREELEREALRLGAQFPAGHAGVFTATSINGLYGNLQRQMQRDSLLQAAVRAGRDSRAVASLLESAGHYDRLLRPNPRLRRMVNRGNQAYGIPRGFLDKTHRYLLSPRVRQYAKEHLAEDFPHSASRGALVCYAFDREGDRANEAGYDMVNWFSGLFGNSVGTFNPEVRRPREQALLQKHVRPLDILLVKSPTHITDKFIPGFFGHAAIYTGTREELEAAGWWSLSEVVPFRGVSAAGGAYAEALRSGVRLSTPEDFTDGDFFLVLRVTGLSPAEKAATTGRIFRYITQKYDFNFDIQSPDRLYCTELIFLAFEMIRWRSHHLWNRETISPDELVWTALENGRIEPVVLIGPETEVLSPSPERIREFMGQ